MIILWLLDILFRRRPVELMAGEFSQEWFNTLKRKSIRNQYNGVCRKTT